MQEAYFAFNPTMPEETDEDPATDAVYGKREKLTMLLGMGLKNVGGTICVGGPEWREWAKNFCCALFVECHFWLAYEPQTTPLPVSPIGRLTFLQLHLPDCYQAVPLLLLSG